MFIILRQLIWRILALVALASGLLLAITHATPLAPDALQGLGLCDNPCWNGIEPGATDFDRVPDLLNAQRLDVVLLNQQLSAAPSYAIQTSTLAGSISATWQHVGYVSLNLRIPLWRLLILLDRPTCVRALGSPQRPTLLEIIWEDGEMALISNFFLDRANHDLVSQSLTLWLSAYSLCETFDNAQPWPGFAALQRRTRQG
jgi:hypothetical protein